MTQRFGSSTAGTIGIAMDTAVIVTDRTVTATTGAIVRIGTTTDTVTGLIEGTTKEFRRGRKTGPHRAPFFPIDLGG